MAPVAAGAAGADVAAAFAAACLWELDALKPGNVHRWADGHGMVCAQFEQSARCAAPAIGRAGARVGERILAAAQATHAAVGCNTNLGILLLCAPLAVAAQRPDARPDAAWLHGATRAVLDALDAEDARATFAAIALANPGGLGSPAENDVRAPPRVPLCVAMRQAEERDAIARQYARGFADLFGWALPRLRASLRQGAAKERALEALYLDFLADGLDSHVLRKFGDTVAQTVSQEARSVRLRHGPAYTSPEARASLLEWDMRLKNQGINPGTSADLTVATAFLHLLAGA